LPADADLLRSGAGEYLSGRLGGVLAHFALVVRMLNVDSQHGDAPGVYNAAGIYLDVVFITREHRRARGQPDRRDVPSAHLPFEFAAETFGPARHARKRSDGRSALESVAAQKFGMFSRLVQI